MGLKILVLTHDPGFSDWIVRELGKASFQAKGILTAHEALAQVSDTHDALLLLDHELPGMPAQELASMLTGRGVCPAFIIMVDPAAKPLAFEMMKLGARDYVIKDIHFMEALISVLTRVGRDLEMERRLHESEKALKKIKAEYRRLFEEVPIGVVRFDKNSVITGCNQYAADLLETSVNLLTGTHLLNTIKNRQHKIAVMNVLAGRESVFQGEDVFNLSKKTGFIRNIYTPLLDETGIADGGICFTEDITEQKRLESDQENLIAAIEQIGEAIIITGPEGDIEYVNPGFEKMTGYTRGEAIGQNPRFMKSGLQDIKFYADLWGAIKSGHQWKGKLTNRRKDGSLYVEEATISPVLDNEGKIKQFVAIKRDISLEIKMEERLRQSQKMESIGSLAGGIAHDFNNLLFPIIGMSELLLEDLPPESQAHENVLEILKAGKRGRDLIEQILAFSRKTEHKMMPVELQQVLKEVLKLSRATIPAEINISSDIQKDCSQVWADPIQIHQIAMNLITNAYHAVEPNKGTIEVRLKEAAFKDCGLDRADLKPGRYAVLSVADTGAGIAPQIMRKIFEPYFTTKEKGKGTGLGLSVVQGIVRTYEGDVQVSSTPGKGSVFDVYLPVMESSSEAQPEESTRNHPTGDEHILLVDDEEVITRLQKQMLERLGYQVTAYTSPTEALEFFKINSDAVDLILTDMSMPEMTGDLLARELISIRSKIPIILCTGFSQWINQENAKACGIREFLKKPLSLSVLARAVRSLLDEKNRNHKGP